MDRRILAMGAWWLTLAGVGSAGAYHVQDVQVEWWAGSGANRVLFVVDFWPGNGEADSFAFGFRFDQLEITGVDLMNGLQAANLGFSYAQDSYGYLTDIWYVKDDITHHAIDNYPASWLSYWISDDFGETWDFAPTGPAERILYDGDTDARLALPGDDWTSVPVTPLAAPTLVGDVNCDGVVSYGDINAFVLALSDADGYYAAYPDCRRINADCNADGVATYADINAFVTLLSQR